jgi:D-arabinose 1-dehydrogenase-like Zn-dependent alcohol dehydrogenase
MRELLDMIWAGDIAPIVEAFDFDMLDAVLQKLARSEIAGRAILKVPQ